MIFDLGGRDRVFEMVLNRLTQKPPENPISITQVENRLENPISITQLENHLENPISITQLENHLENYLETLSPTFILWIKEKFQLLFYK